MTQNAPQQPPSFFTRDKAEASNENVFLNIGFNILAPSLVLSKLSGGDSLGPVNSLLLALSFPLIYGVWDLIQKRKVNFFSLLGLISTLLTGGFSLFQLEGIWFAVKEASVPLLFGIFVFFSGFTKAPFVKKIFFQSHLMNLDKIESLLNEERIFERLKKVIFETNFIVSLSLFLSAALNFFLAVYLLKSPTGSPEFNQELAKMTALSFPVISIPVTLVMMGGLFYLFHQLKKITGLDLNELMADTLQKNNKS